MTIKTDVLSAWQMAAIAKVLEGEHPGVFNSDLDDLRKIFNGAVAVTVRRVVRDEPTVMEKRTAAGCLFTDALRSLDSVTEALKGSQDVKS